jgi:glucose/arabinose dehydrogenase
MVLGSGCAGEPATDEAQQVEDDVTVQTGFVASPVATGLVNPVAMAFATDGRLFVAEQAGALRVVKNASLLTTPFIKLDVDSRGERGLLGVAFSPTFASDRFVYVYYTSKLPIAHNRVSRFTAQGDTAVLGSERVLLDLDPLSTATNHNGGAIHFGPDGKLYIGVGENANRPNAQSFSNLLGKMLRINADGTVPTDNPFVRQTTGKNQAIWAMGLRNPFTFAFQPGTGRIFINDVGQSTFEEINDGIAGKNYGWPNVEGTGTDARFTNPIFTYGHGQSPTTGCSIAGGAFYNPAVPTLGANLVGSYFYADVCGGWIRRFDPRTGTSSAFASETGFPVDLQVGPEGDLYYLSRETSAVTRIRKAAAGPVAPVIVTQPTSVSVTEGLPATFRVGASGTALRYQWFRNTLAIAGATSSTFTLPSVTRADNGATFNVVVKGVTTQVSSATVTLRVTTGGTVTPVNFTRDIAPIFAARCTACHGGAGNLDLDGASAVGNLRNIASTCGGVGAKRVVPGNPQASLLWQKLAGDPRACGRPMPAGSRGLKFVSPSEFALFERWIAEGAN